MTKFKQRYSVICSDIDLKSQMKPLSAPIYFQDCFIRYAAKNCFATFDLEPKGLSWFISDYNLSLKEDLPYWSENFDVQIWISKISKLKVYVDFIYTYKNEIFAKGSSTWVLFNNTDKKLATTDVIFQNYNKTESPLQESQIKIQWNNIKDSIRTIEHTANRTDLDFNGHVNNRSYVNIAITTASKEIQDNYYIKKLAVKFIQQAFMDDKLICTSYSTEYEKEYITNIKTARGDVCKIYTAWQQKTHGHNILECDLAIRHPL